MKRTLFNLVNSVGWALIIAAAGFIAQALWSDYTVGNIAPHLKVALLYLILLWIFIGADTRSFSFVKGQSYLGFKHYMMLVALFINFTLGGFDVFTAMYAFVFLYALVDCNQKNGRWGIQAGAWLETLPHPISLGQVLNILNEKLMLVEVTDETDFVRVQGRSFLGYEILIEIWTDHTKIDVRFASSPFVFIWGGKIAPLPLGFYYAKRLTQIAPS